MARTFKVMLAVLVILVLAGSAYAFAAANTIQASNAGYEASVVSGFAITNVVYGFNTDPTKLDSISFDIAPISGGAAPQTVQISTAATQNFTGSECVLAGTSPIVATCTFGTVSVPVPVTVKSVVALDIVASSNP